MTICTHTIVKNGAEFIKPVLEAVRPYVDRMLVSVDETSTDGTADILKEMGIKFEYHQNTNSFRDLVKARNNQLKQTKEDWIWILDDDEYYPKDVILEILNELKTSTADAYALRFWFPIDKETYQRRRTNKHAERIYRYKPELEWRGTFTSEALYDNYGHLWHRLHPNIKFFNCRYIHLSYLKKYSWRKEMGNLYPDYHNKTKNWKLGQMPQEIINIIKKIYEDNKK